MKLHKPNHTVLNAKGKYSQRRHVPPLPAGLRQSVLEHLDLSQLGDLATTLLNDKYLEVSKVRPFFWSLVETYVDRFQFYPFDASKALFSHLELNDYPEETIQQLVEQLESKFEKSHGRPLRQSSQRLAQQAALDDEIKALRDTLKYAAMVAENSEKE